MKLFELEIKNFKSISDAGCRIRIDEIVVLIGQNNAGKSTVLDAYEAFASSGTQRDISEFHHQNDSKPIQITGTFKNITEDDKNKIGEKWIFVEHGTEYVKVMWEWVSPNDKGIKKSFNREENEFENGGMGGWDSLFISSIPFPVRIRPTDPVDKTQSTIVGMLKEYVKTKLKEDSSKTSAVLDQISNLTEELFQEYKSQFESISTKMVEDVSKIFPNTKIELIPQSKSSIDEKILGAESFIRVSNGQYSSPLILQGTGMQRALLWSALDIMTRDKKNKTTDTPKILLIDEPEAFLHPPTVRSACEMLYDFAIENPSWQVIATTHSPIFIDLAKNHTTIIRVNPECGGEQKYISTDEMRFDGDEKKNIKMVRACNPTVNEFFFYDNIFLVEGPTEQIVLNHVAEKIDKKIHVIDCLGKGNIPMFARILNKFNVPYTIIHDSDVPKVRKKTGVCTNSAWTTNQKIREAAGCSENAKVKIFVQFPHFEGHFLDESMLSGKVDNVLSILSNPNDESYLKIYDCYSKLLEGDGSLYCSTADVFEEKRKEYMRLSGSLDDELWSE